jgi:hypothetical protein
MDTDLQDAAYLPTTSPYADARVVSPLPTPIVDWVYVQLRSTSSGATVAARSAFLRDDGMLVDDSGAPPVKMNHQTDGDYYVVVRHRDHLALMSSSAISLNQATSTLYDFTDSQGKAYGTAAMKQLITPTPVYGMVGGDAATVFGIVDSADRVAIWNDNADTGYLYTDVTLSGNVDASDRVLCWNDRGRISQVPDNGEMLGELLDEASTDSTSAWTIGNQMVNGFDDARKFSFDVVVSFTGTPPDFKIGSFSLRVLYDDAELTNPSVPTGLSAFYKELWPGEVEQWDTMGYFHLTEATVGDASVLLMDLDMALLQGAYSSQGYTSSLLPLGSADGGQLLCRIEFDVRNPETFTPAAARLAWDDGVMGDGHFRSSVAMKKMDESGETVTSGASFEVEGEIVTPTPTPGAPEPTSTPEAPGTPTPSPAPAPTPGPALELQVILLEAGESFELELRLDEDITSPFDFYLFAEVMGRYYTISMNGEVSAGIQALYRDVPGYAAPVALTIRSLGAIPESLAGVNVTLYAIAIESGRVPEVSGIDELGPDSGNVLAFDRREVDIL